MKLIEKLKKAKLMRKKKEKERLDRRNWQIYYAVKNKKGTLKKIGEEHNLSPERIRQIHAKKRNKINTFDDWAIELSVRTQNALRNSDYWTKEKAIEAIKNSKLAPGKVKNYGLKSHIELCNHLGMNYPTDYELAKLRARKEQLILQIKNIDEQINERSKKL